MHFLFLAVLALFVAATTSAKPGQLTNSQRLARGLPPLPAKFGRNLPGMVPREPTPAHHAKRQQASLTPQSSWKIQVREGSNVVGYVGNTASGCSSVSQDSFLLVAISGSGPFDLMATNPAFPAPFFVGAPSGTSGSKAPFGNVPQGSESTIWSIDSSSNQLTPAGTSLVLSGGQLFFAPGADASSVAVSLFLVNG